MTEAANLRSDFNYNASGFSCKYMHKVNICLTSLIRLQAGLLLESFLAGCKLIWLLSLINENWGNLDGEQKVFSFLNVILKKILSRDLNNLTSVFLEIASLTISNNFGLF